MSISMFSQRLHPQCFLQTNFFLTRVKASLLVSESPSAAASLSASLYLMVGGKQSERLWPPPYSRPIRYMVMLYAYFSILGHPEISVFISVRSGNRREKPTSNGFLDFSCWTQFLFTAEILYSHNMEYFQMSPHRQSAHNAHKKAPL